MWKSPYNKYYRILDEDGNVRLETIFEQEALDFVSKIYEESKKLLFVEEVIR